MIVNLELCAEDRARIETLSAKLDVLADALSIIGYALASKAEGSVKSAAPVQVAEPVKAPEPSETVFEFEAGAPVETEPEPVKAAPAPVSLAEFQKALTLRCAESAEMKARVRALLNEYASAASAVPEGKRAEILARLAAL